jgi:hypothetical protein
MPTKIPQEETWAPNAKKRVLLDTNIWRYVVDSGAQGALLRVARDGLYNVQIAPGVIYETLRLKDASVRAALARLMTSSCFHRLMPEAYSESMEILREIERVRPDWLRKEPDLKSFNFQKKDWTRKTAMTRRTTGFWVRSARSPGWQAQLVEQVDDGMIEKAREGAKYQRKVMAEKWKRNFPIDKALVEPVAGFRGPVEASRMESFNRLSDGLSTKGHPYRDWIGPFLKLDDGLLISAAWAEFWLRLADKSALPRQWLRWAHLFAQRFRTLTPGGPGDQQLFTYFVDTDVLVTADKALTEMLEECRPYAPCKLPEGKVVAGGAAGVADVLRLLDT